jgi:hypothetical protein
VCVFRRDHHCESVDNCIGVGNHGAFVLLLALQVLASSYYMWLFHQQTHLTLQPGEPTGLHVFGWARRVVTICLYGLALSDVLYVGRLLVWQIAYLLHDVTTLEHLRVEASHSATTGASASEGPSLRDVARTIMELKAVPALPPAGAGQPAEGAAKLLLLLKSYRDDMSGLLRFLCRASLASIAHPCDACARLLPSLRVAGGVLLFGCRRTPAE